MKAALFTLLITLNLINSVAQVCTTAVIYDYIETYTWQSGWNVGSNGGYYTNAFVSSNQSAAVIGGGNGTSVIEDGYYILPNVTGLVSTNTHYLEFRLASYKFSNSTAATAGTDAADYVDLQYSSNAGTSYTSELRITGNSNALWTYNSTAIASKTVSGALTTMAPTAGGDRTSLGDGYSIIRLTLPSGTTQAAFRIYCRVNSAGEEWWLDNIILYTIGPCVPLPIELLEFTGENQTNFNHLTWTTATELNNSHFDIERSLDAINWNNIAHVIGNGTSFNKLTYEFNDFSFERNTINYYRLRQVDFNGDFKYSQIIAVSSEPEIKCKEEYYNFDGKEINFKTAPNGLYIRKCGLVTEKVLKLD